MLLRRSTYNICMKTIAEKSNITWPNGKPILEDYEEFKERCFLYLYITDRNELALLNTCNLHGEYEILNIHEFSELCEKKCPKN